MHLIFYLRESKDFLKGRLRVRAIRPHFNFTNDKADICGTAFDRKRQNNGKGGRKLAEESYPARRRIGRDYQIIRLLGSGGDGSVYLVRHSPTEQLRAAKRLKADTIRQRRHELDMMKYLRHPALPQVFDVLEEQGELWLIMEYINGRPLSALEKEEPAPAMFFSIARQLSDVLLYLHTRKTAILHLDIKPSNIILRPDGRLGLIDFGAAVRAVPTRGKGVCFGTPGFAAPEQSDPDAIPDSRADIYGVGAVLYYCLYREIPKLPACRARMQTDRTRWRRSLGPLLLRCLETDKEKRFSDTRALCAAVRRAERRCIARFRRRRGCVALMFLLSALIFAAANMGGKGRGGVESAETRKEYRTLLEQADGLGFEQAVSCYEQAIALCPEDAAWCERLLDRIDADYLFSQSEEETLKKLVFSAPQGQTETADDLLAQSSPEYGALAYRIGLAYWYFYEGAGGKSAAAKWFRRAIESQDMQDDSSDAEPKGNAPKWLSSARIHARIGSYYETLGKRDADGRQQTDLGTYWADLTELWGLENLSDESIGVRCEIAKELLSVLVMRTHELNKQGIKPEQLQETLASIEVFVRENSGAGEIIQACGEQCGLAREAMGREIGKERG